MRFMISNASVIYVSYSTESGMFRFTSTESCQEADKEWPGSLRTKECVYRHQNRAVVPDPSLLALVVAALSSELRST